MFTKVAAGFFGLIALLHAVRLWYGWDAMIGGFAIPIWVSGVVLVVSALMARGLWNESK